MLIRIPNERIQGLLQALVGRRIIATSRFAAMGFQHFTVAKEGKDLSTESYAVAIILSRDRMAISLFGRYGCFCSDNRWLYSVVVRCNDDRAAVRASSVI